MLGRVPELTSSARIVPRTLALVFVIASVVACGDNVKLAVDGPPPVPVSVEVGTGLDAFVPLVDGDPVLLVEGPQGGRHVFGHARMHGMEPGTSRADGPMTRFDVFALDGRRLSADIPPFTEPYVATAAGYELPSARFVFIEVLGAEILDTMVELRLQVTDRNGNSGEDSRRVIVKPYEGD